MRAWKPKGGNAKTPSGIELHYADGLHDWGDGCTDFRLCYWPVVVYGAAVGSLAPDIPVAMSYAQFAAGEDPTLDAALADLHRRQTAAYRP